MYITETTLKEKLSNYSCFMTFRNDSLVSVDGLASHSHPAIVHIVFDYMKLQVTEKKKDQFHTVEWD